MKNNIFSFEKDNNLYTKSNTLSNNYLEFIGLNKTSARYDEWLNPIPFIFFVQTTCQNGVHIFQWLKKNQKKNDIL